MKKYILLSEKIWNSDALNFLINKVNADWILIDKKEDFTFHKIQSINPDLIFIPHWSYLISEDIFVNYECIVFHMTDLPFGRGGSPLQNLIERKIYETKVSALKVIKELDAGPIYIKEPLSLWGTAEEIFIRANTLIIDMIVNIIENKITPNNQVGEVVGFDRRKPEQGNIINLNNLEEVFDFIRMLDAPGYPKAYIESSNFKFEFSRASIKSDKSIIADVRIFKK